jgi:hypothetical protein
MQRDPLPVPPATLDRRVLLEEVVVVLLYKFLNP